MSTTHVCPLCNGMFRTNDLILGQRLMKDKRNQALQLRKAGFTIRQIMKAMKYKSPRSVQVLLDAD